MARGRDPIKPGARPALGFRTYADDTPRADLGHEPPRDDPWPEPDYVDPEDLAWEPPPALGAAPPQETGQAARPRWPALLIAGVAAMAVAGAWGYGVLRHGPLPAAMQAAAPAAPAAPARQLAVQRAPADAGAPTPPQRLETARLAPLTAAPPPRAPAPPARAPQPQPALQASAGIKAVARQPASLPPVIAVEPPAAPPPPPSETPAPAPPAAAAVEAEGRSAGTLERQPPPEARLAPAPRPLDCAAIRSAAQDIVCRDPGLMAAERRMARAYAAALAAGAPEPALREDQDDWRRIREAAARRSKQAVEDVYHQRIDELEAMARPR